MFSVVRPRHVAVIAASLLATTLVPVAPSFATEVAPPETVLTTLNGLPSAPGVAHASSDDRLNVSDAVTVDDPFSMLGFVLPEGSESAEVRTRDLEGEWSEWVELDALDPAMDGPDPGTEESDAAVENGTDPLWVGGADTLQVRLDGKLDELHTTLIDTEGHAEGRVAKAVRHLRPQTATAPADASAARPRIVTRAQWGANESWRRGDARYATPRAAVIHHTAGSNNYSRNQAPAVVRGIYSYHTRTLGWADVGYNLLVDRYGTVYEGRRGGVDRGVVGAHASGFNSGTFGVGAMGNYDVAHIPDAAFNAVAQVVAWKYGVHDINANSGRTVQLNGRTLPTAMGHRDVGQTACPGRHFHAKLGQLRNRIQSRAAPSAPPTRFSDVPRHHAHYASIEDVASQQVAYGCAAGRYCPQRNLTRGQLASFLQRALDLPDARRQPFRDVSGPHADAIAAVAAAGVTQGCAPNRYCPDRPVTRAHMAAFLQRALNLPNRPSRFPDTTGNPHRFAIGAVSHAGIADGYRDGTFGPSETVNRAQMAAFLSRTLAR